MHFHFTGLRFLKIQGCQEDMKFFDCYHVSVHPIVQTKEDKITISKNAQNILA